MLVVAGIVGASGPAIGTAKGETSQQAGQQSLGVRGKESSRTADPEAKKDVAQGSGFEVGLCNFSVGDQVRVDGFDMGIVTTIKRLIRRTTSNK